MEASLTTLQAWWSREQDQVVKDALNKRIEVIINGLHMITGGQRSALALILSNSQTAHDGVLVAALNNIINHDQEIEAEMGDVKTIAATALKKYDGGAI